jgi:hypothetical protein
MCVRVYLNLSVRLSVSAHPSVRYITMTTFLLLNLFIGVIVNNMMETKAAAEQKKEEAKAWYVLYSTSESAHNTVILALCNLP